MCEASRRHHETTMWQLLGFYLGVTGVLLQFWLNSQPFTEVTAESNSFLILFVPLFLGVFTAVALLKHKFFWRQDLARAMELEKDLEFNRERAYSERFYLHPLRYLRAGEMAFLAVSLTVAGVAYLIGRSFWFKPPTGPFGTFWFPVYVAAIPFSFTLYGFYRKLMVNREVKKSGSPPEIPARTSPKFPRFVIIFGVKTAAGLIGSVLLFLSFQESFLRAPTRALVFETWLSSVGGVTSIIILTCLAAVESWTLGREWMKT